MIDRPDYISRIKPFIGLEPVKVLTGLRRSGKSVMLELIQKELMSSGVFAENIIHINFEDMNTPLSYIDIISISLPYWSPFHLPSCAHKPQSFTAAYQLIHELYAFTAKTTLYSIANLPTLFSSVHVKLIYTILIYLYVKHFLRIVANDFCITPITVSKKSLL